MQVAKTDVLRLVDDYSVGIRNIETALDDRSTEEHVIIPCHELKNLVFKNLRFHLAMSHAYLHIRHYPVQDIMDGLKFLHPVMDEEYLSSPVEFISDDLPDLIIVKEHDFSLHRNPVRRRSRDYRQVSRTQERELEGSRDRSSRQGKSVHRSLELAQLLLCAHSEFLLLIDDQQTEILELESLSYQFMCTYDDIESTSLESFLDIGNLFRSPQTADIVHVTWKVLQTALESLEMLQCKNGSRHEHGHLLAVSHSLECSTDRNLGLTESHVTADKSVHWTIVLHIPLDSLYCLLLIGSILVHE